MIAALVCYSICASAQATKLYWDPFGFAPVPSSDVSQKAPLLAEMRAGEYARVFGSVAQAKGFKSLGLLDVNLAITCCRQTGRIYELTSFADKLEKARPNSEVAAYAKVAAAVLNYANQKVGSAERALAKANCETIASQTEAMIVNHLPILIAATNSAVLPLQTRRSLAESYTALHRADLAGRIWRIRLSLAGSLYAVTDPITGKLQLRQDGSVDMKLDREGPSLTQARELLRNENQNDPNVMFLTAKLEAFSAAVSRDKAKASVSKRAASALIDALSKRSDLHPEIQKMVKKFRQRPDYSSLSLTSKF